jgi:hypothetical protein
VFELDDVFVLGFEVAVLELDDVFVLGFEVAVFELELFVFGVFELVEL